MALRTSTFKAIADFSALHRESRAARIELQRLQAVGRPGQGLGPGGPLDRGFRSTARSQAAFTRESRRASDSVSGTRREVRGLASDMGRAETSTYRFGRTVKGASGSLLQVVSSLGLVRIGVASLATAMTLLGVVAAGVGVSFNASMEQVRTGFTSILKDGDKANDLMERVIETARVTPFETVDLSKNVQRLLAYGFDLEEVLRGTGMEAEGLVVSIGNAVAAMGGSRDQFQGVVRALGQIRTRGQVMGEELMQIAEQGIPVYEILQEKLGLTGDQVQRIGELGIKADVAIGAIEQGLAERFGGAMEAQSRTMLGLLSTLRDNIQIGLGKAFEGLFKIAKSALNGIGTALTEINTRAAQVGFLDALREQFPALAPLFHAVAAAAREIVDVMKELAPIASAAVKTFTTLAGAGLIVSLEAIAAVLQVIESILRVIPEPITQAAAAAGVLLLTFRAIRSLKVFGTIAKAVQSLIAWMTSAAVATNAQNVALAAQAKLLANINAQVAIGTAQGGVNILVEAAKGTASMNALNTATQRATLATTGLRGAMAGLGTRLAAFFTNPITIATLAIGGIIAAIDAWEKHLQGIRDKQFNAATAATELAGALKIATGEIGDLNDVQGESVQAAEALYQQNEKLKKQIDAIAALSGKSRQAALVALAYELRLRGTSIEDIIKTIKSVADAAGIKVDVEMIVKRSGEAQSVIDDFGTQVQFVADKAAKDLATSARYGYEGYANMTAATEGNFKALGDQINDTFKADRFGQGLAMIAEFQTSLEEQGLTVEQQRTAWVELTDTLAGGLGLDATSSEVTKLRHQLTAGSITTDEYARGLLDLAATQGSISPKFKIFIQQLLESGAAGDDLLGFIQEFVQNNPDADLNSMGSAATEAGEGIKFLGEEFTLSGKALEAWQKQIEQTRQMLLKFVDAAGIYSDLLSEATDEMKKIAQDRADAYNKELEREQERRKEDLEDEIKHLERKQEVQDEIMRARHKKQVDDLRASGKYTAEQFRQLRDQQVQEELAAKKKREALEDTVDARKDEIDNLDDQKKSWEDYEETVTVSLDKVAAAMQEKIAALRQMTANYSKVTAEHGRDVAQALLDMDPSGKLLEGVATDAAGSQQLVKATEDYLDATSQAAAEGLEQTWMVLNEIHEKGGKASAEAMAKSLGLSVEQVMQIANKWAKVGGDAAAAFKEAADKELEGWYPGKSETAAETVERYKKHPDQAPKRRPHSETGGSSTTGLLHGGILSFAGGGWMLPQQATIAKGRPGGLVNWAEHGTGGEAFIPLADDKRRRSRMLWAKVGHMLYPSGGDALADFARASGRGSGSMSASYLFGGFSSPTMPPITGVYHPPGSDAAKRQSEMWQQWVNQTPWSWNKQEGGVPPSRSTNFTVSGNTIVAQNPMDLIAKLEALARLKMLNGKG